MGNLAMHQCLQENLDLLISQPFPTKKKVNLIKNIEIIIQNFLERI